MRRNKIPKRIIVIDFDGTIVECDYPNIGKIRNNARHYINKLHSEGYGIVINTCRSGLAEADAIHFLRDNGIRYDYINCNFPHLIEKYGQDCRKISGDVYIEDRCLFTLPKWHTIYDVIKIKERKNKWEL